MAVYKIFANSQFGPMVQNAHDTREDAEKDLPFWQKKWRKVWIEEWVDHYNKTLPRYHNTAERTVRGKGVPPEKQADAPQLFGHLTAPGVLLQLMRMDSANGTTEYVIVGPEGQVYVQADTMRQLMSWLTDYARLVDSPKS